MYYGYLPLSFPPSNWNDRRILRTKKIQFRSLDDCIECYGRENLVAIDTLPQIIFYTSKGVQPKFVSENQTKQGKISCWFLKNETSFVYKLWQESNQKKR